MSKIMKHSLAAGIVAAFSLSVAHADFVGVADAPNGGLRYEGLGETSAGSGIGTGFYQLGDCSFDGMNTTCVVSGSYTEDATSTNSAGDTGTFVFRQIFSGTDNPVIAQSNAPNSDSLVLSVLGDAIFEIVVTTSTGDVFTGIFPDDPFSESIGFSAFLAVGATCTGLTSGPCSVSNVGQTAGAVIEGGISPFVFTLPDALLVGDPVPLPAAAWLFGAGIAGIGAVRRKKTS